MSSPVPPDLEPRFCMPEGWRWQRFVSDTGHKIRFGQVMPQGEIRGVVVALQGLSEFGEKYFETAHDMLTRGFGFFIMDWRGQGGSDRYFPVRPHRRHSNSLAHDLKDLDQMIRSAVMPAVDPGTPIIMLGHSMGGNIGIRYLHDYPGVFTCAVFSAPMFGINAIGWMPGLLAGALTTALGPFHNYYVPGGGDWDEHVRANPGQNVFSSDPVRDAIHTAWFQANPALQIGNVTFGWVHEALLSCRTIMRRDFLKAIQTPCLFAVAGREALVDNRAIRRAAATIPYARLLELPDARHEILMESDNSRKPFLEAFDNMVQTVMKKESTPWMKPA